MNTYITKQQLLTVNIPFLLKRSISAGAIQLHVVTTNLWPHGTGHGIFVYLITHFLLKGYWSDCIFLNTMSSFAWGRPPIFTLIFLDLCLKRHYKTLLYRTDAQDQDYPVKTVTLNVYMNTAPLTFATRENMKMSEGSATGVHLYVY